MENTVLDEILETSLELDSNPISAHELGSRMDTDELTDIIRHREVLEALMTKPLDRTDLEARLDISRATSHCRDLRFDYLLPTTNTVAGTSSPPPAGS